MEIRNKTILSILEFKRRHPRFILLSLIFVIIPMTASFVLGLEMKKEVALSIPTVVFDGDNSNFSKELIQKVDDSQAFTLVDSVKSYEAVNTKIRNGKAMVGLIIPEGFYQDMIKGEAPKILSIYDGSTLAVITTSKTNMADILLDLKMEYMTRVYEKEQNIAPAIVKNIVKPLDFVTRILYNPAKNFKNFLLPGMLVAIVQVAITMNGAEVGFESRLENRVVRRRLKDIGKWAMVSTASILSVLSVQWIFFGIPLRGTVLGMIILTYLYSLVLTSFGYIFGMIIPDRAFASQLSCVFILPTSILGGYTWPVLAMPQGIQTFAKFLPYTYYGNTIRSLCLKPMEIKHIAGNMLSLSVYFAVLIIIIIGIGKIREKRNNERVLQG